MAVIKPFKWRNSRLVILDQTKLPFKQKWKTLKTYREVGKAIKQLEVRGAPLIGIIAAYGCVLGAFSLKKTSYTIFRKRFIKLVNYLQKTRPTAVNLSRATERMKRIVLTTKNQKTAEIIKKLVEEAHRIANEDFKTNQKISKIGNALIKSPSTILTHCNTGALATSGWGTALGVIKSAARSKKVQVIATETRPLLQGARLTVWELKREKIPTILISDTSVGYIMQNKLADLVLVGADRIASNGDTANKIGTYNIAVIAKTHGIPFYVVAPTSSIDNNISSGKNITIEERSGVEVKKINHQFITLKNIRVLNPAFDITPAEYITGIVTEKGIYRFPYKF